MKRATKKLSRELEMWEKNEKMVKKVIDELIPNISSQYSLEMAEDVYDIAEMICEENLEYSIRFLHIIATMTQSKKSAKYLERLFNGPDKDMRKFIQKFLDQAESSFDGIFLTGFLESM